MSGSVGGILALGGLTLFLVFVGAAVASIFHIHAGEEDLSFVDAGWEVLQRAIDPGQLDGELKWESRILLLFVTSIGILLISTLISIVNSTLERRIEQLRRGRGPVEATNHIVVLGWNDLGAKVCEELAEANIDSEPSEVVILADQPPYEVMQEIREDLQRRRFLERGSSESQFVKRPETWLTVRRGDITSVDDLAMLARLSTARSVIILDGDESDAETTKVILAIVASIQTEKVTRKTPLNIIATLSDDSLARRLKERIHYLSLESEAAGEPVAEVIPITPALFRTGIEAQVARHRGLSEVYRDLLDFDEEELYLVPPPSGTTTFGEVADTAGVAVLGLMSEGRVDLWPDWSADILGKTLVVLAESKNSAHAALNRDRRAVLAGQRGPGRPMASEPERFLVIGWNRTGKNLTASLLRNAPQSSSVTVLAHVEDHLHEEELRELGRVEVTIRVPEIDPLDDRGFVEQFDHVIVLAHEELAAAESDALVLADVLACRMHVGESSSRREQPATVVAELRQRVSKNIAGVRLTDDLLLSDSLRASAMVQLAVNPELLPVLSALLVPEVDNPVHLTGNTNHSDSPTGRRWEEVRRELMQTTGELAIAVRGKGIIAEVDVNPPADRLVLPGEEVIVLSRRTV